MDSVDVGDSHLGFSVVTLTLGGDPGAAALVVGLYGVWVVLSSLARSRGISMSLVVHVIGGSGRCWRCLRCMGCSTFVCCCLCVFGRC